VSSRKLHCQAGGAPSRAGVGVGAGSPQARHQRIIPHSPKCCGPVAADRRQPGQFKRGSAKGQRGTQKNNRRTLTYIAISYI
jgi:hypothetical protein